MQTFSESTFYQLCDELGRRDPDLQAIIDVHGYPPFWSRPNTYETLVHIILEQQVSLASAKAALEKLRAKVNVITPENVDQLSDEELRAVYFSRQKTTYVRSLTEAILQKRLNLDELALLSDQVIRERLVQLKGIGNWTVDVYLIMVLHRGDHFPTGDIAAVNGLKQRKGLRKETSAEALLKMINRWRPYRSVGTMLIWHDYLSRRQKLKTAPPV